MVCNVQTGVNFCQRGACWQTHTFEELVVCARLDESMPGCVPAATKERTIPMLIASVLTGHYMTYRLAVTSALMSGVLRAN